MKIPTYSLVISLIASTTLAQEYVAPQNNTPAYSLAARNPLDRRAIDYCGASTYYCLQGDCCGITAYNCLPTGAQCCASLSAYGFGLFCYSGTSCVIQGGYVQCQKSGGGGFVSAGSTLRPTATGTAKSSSKTATATTATDDDDEPEETGSGSSSSSGSGDSKTKTKKKGKSKMWIVGAVVGPIVGIAVIAAVLVFLCVMKRKQKKKAEVAASSAAVMAANNNHNNDPNNGGTHFEPKPPLPTDPSMSSVPYSNNGGPPMSQPNPDYKPTVFAHNYEQQQPPTPISSPPPQWSPAANNPAAPQNGQWAPSSPAPGAISPAPMNVVPAAAMHHAPPSHTANELYGQSATGPVSPTANTGGYGQWMHHGQPGHVNAMELPTGSGVQSPPKNGAQELG